MTTTKGTTAHRAEPRKEGHAGDHSSHSGSLTVCLNGFLEETEKELHHVRDGVVLLF